MVIIVKRLVPVYGANTNVPKKYLNLRKGVYVTTFSKLYPNIEEILVNEYGLKPDEKIIVFWMKSVSRPGWREYRLPFKKVYSGRLSEFGEYLRKVREDS